MVPDPRRPFLAERSDAATRRHRIAGLESGLGYEYQVRPWIASGAGDASPAAIEGAPFAGPDGIVYGDPGMVEPGGTFRLHGSKVTFTVPDEMRLRVGHFAHGFLADTIGLEDVATGSYLWIDVNLAEVHWRYLADPRADLPAGAADSAPLGRDVNALFDTIGESLREVPHP